MDDVLEPTAVEIPAILTGRMRTYRKFAFFEEPGIGHDHAPRGIFFPFELFLPPCSAFAFFACPCGAFFFECVTRLDPEFIDSGFVRTTALLSGHQALIKGGCQMQLCLLAPTLPLSAQASA